MSKFPIKMFFCLYQHGKNIPNNLLLFEQILERWFLYKFYVFYVGSFADFLSDVVTGMPVVFVIAKTY